jgi:hypothetical protein
MEVQGVTNDSWLTVAIMTPKAGGETGGSPGGAVADKTA